MYCTYNSIKNMGENRIMTAYDIIVDLAGIPPNEIVSLIYYILAGIMIVIFFISIIYLMKVILTGILRLGDL
jgi:hypothetical protein